MSDPFNLYDRNEKMLPQSAKAIELDHPPCRDCKYWLPRKYSDIDGAIKRVVLCHADEMHFDFTCFKNC
mgnify:CR=1 FL=1